MDAEQRKKIEELYLEMYSKMIAYAQVNLEEGESAEEAVQETFRIACQLPDRLLSSPNPQGWLILTLRNTIRNTKKNRATAKRITDQYLLYQCKETAISQDEIDLNVLYENLANEEDFRLLKEYAVEGRSILEMAKDRDITLEACQKRLQRARVKLQNKLKV
jgi:RNA polymerase sigma-70 factor (ECF subfamily)